MAPSIRPPLHSSASHEFHPAVAVGEQKADQGHRGQVGHRGVQGDDLAAEQVQAAGQQGQGGHLAQAAADHARGAMSVMAASGHERRFSALASGVAVATASTGVQNSGQFGAGWRGQVVMITGQKTIRNARAASAGFIKFLPMPPNSCLTMTMAKASPMSTIHSGAGNGQAVGEQHAGDHRGQIANGVGLFHQHLVQPFKGHAACQHDDQCHRQGPQAEDVDGDRHGRAAGR